MPILELTKNFHDIVAMTPRHSPRKLANGERMLKIPPQWTNEMSIGVDAIDADHQILFSMLNRTRAMSEKGGDPDVFGSVLADLYVYTTYHFEREEAVMEACGYPDMESHRQAHSALKEKVHQLLSEPSFEGNTDLLAALLNFLENWLAGHIMGMDKRFEPWGQGKEELILKALFDYEQADAKKITPLRTVS